MRYTTPTKKASSRAATRAIPPQLQNQCTRVGAGTNLTWWALVLDVAFPATDDPERAVRATAESQRHAIEVLFDALSAFDEVRSAHDGLATIFRTYERCQHDDHA